MQPQTLRGLLTSIFFSDTVVSSRAVVSLSLLLLLPFFRDPMVGIPLLRRRSMYSRFAYDNIPPLSLLVRGGRFSHCMGVPVFARVVALVYSMCLKQFPSSIAPFLVYRRYSCRPVSPGLTVFLNLKLCGRIPRVCVCVFLGILLSFVRPALCTLLSWHRSTCFHA